jgi:hypothetical protein
MEQVLHGREVAHRRQRLSSGDASVQAEDGVDVAVAGAPSPPEVLRIEVVDAPPARLDVRTEPAADATEAGSACGQCRADPEPSRQGNDAIGGEERRGSSFDVRAREEQLREDAREVLGTLRNHEEAHTLERRHAGLERRSIRHPASEVLADAMPKVDHDPVRRGMEDARPVGLADPVAALVALDAVGDGLGHRPGVRHGELHVIQPGGEPRIVRAEEEADAEDVEAAL